MPLGETSLQFVTVGDPGNVADTEDGNVGCGSVSYAYRMGTYDVTFGQYCQFLNAVARTDPYGLYNNWHGLQQTTFPVDPASARRAVRAVTATPWQEATRKQRIARACICQLGRGGAILQLAAKLLSPQGPRGTGTTETGAYTLNGNSTRLDRP